MLHLYTDGACRGNPGHGGAGFVLTDGYGNIVEKGSKYLGICTNNVAEYRALILGLGAAVRHPCSKLLIRLDSELLVKQIKGTYRVKNPKLKLLMEEVRNLFSRIKSYTVEHVPRLQNTLADELANEAIDRVLK